MDKIILEAVGSEWSTRKEIIHRLKMAGLMMNERAFRYWVEDWNDKYCNQKVDIYIAHSPKGYKATEDVDEIKDSVDDLKRRALDMMKKYSDTRKALGMRIQTQLFEE